MMVERTITCERCSSRECQIEHEQIDYYDFDLCIACQEYVHALHFGVAEGSNNA